jgi:putative DNA primase/helicase
MNDCNPRIDDAGTKWYKCENCNRETSTPKRKVISALTGFNHNQNEKEIFNPNTYAKQLMDNFFFKTDQKTDILYIYNSESGIWENEGEIFVHKALVEALGEDVKPHYLPDVIFYIKGISYENVKETPNLIALENGILDVEKQELLEKSPGYFITSKIPVTYDINAKCLNILKFLIEVFGENQLIALQEALGYTLHKEPLFEKAFMLIGDGANGKSTFLNLLQAFLGPGNYSNVTLQELCFDRFASANLYGKMANISADLPKTAISTSGRFKMLTGRDMINAQFKNKNAFQFLNTAKPWFSCNEFPQTTEDTLAYVRRWKIFNCIAVFIGEKADPKLLEKLTTEIELSGFLNWIIEGLKRLLTNGKFNVTETEETLRENILKLSNPAKAFLEANIEKSTSSTDFIIETELYAEFITFCDKENLPTVRKSQFTQALTEYIPESKQTKQRILGKPVKVYQFIKRTVPTVPSDLFASERNLQNSKVNSEVGTEGTEPWECGECINFHKPECSFPHGIDCTGFHCDYAKGCKEYKKREASK